MGNVTPITDAKRRRAPDPGTVLLPPVPCRSVPSARSLPSSGGRGGEYGLGDVARPLGLAHFEIRTIIDALRVEAAHNGMPLPKTPRHEKGKPITGPRAIVRKSRWDAGEMDAWLESRQRGQSSLPPPGVSQSTREEMARRAAGMGRG
ncbi:hypothetical protein [Stakelama pacifica]|uniref:Uncharacterized protein n=1 Tax=Stakelama pacifica TaxID=517720 RepID=A0A4V3BTJ7_9SPHN|nr:hypothetical protein [Stakelama pacifica]TDN83008.1 hypothetical protein EV664_105206 [Stakelama pacifica]GGO94942.1 hypothetical protein GCM10011329_17960 [Stakelama pacifica]